MSAAVKIVDAPAIVLFFSVLADNKANATAWTTLAPTRPPRIKSPLVIFPMRFNNYKTKIIIVAVNNYKIKIIVAVKKTKRRALIIIKTKIIVVAVNNYKIKIIVAVKNTKHSALIIIK